MIQFVRKIDAGQPWDATTPTLTLALDQRSRARLRVRLDDGRDAALVLPRGTQLRDGDLLESADGLLARVRAAAERLSSVSSADPLLLARACYHLGNRHVPLQIEAGCLRYPHDHVLDDLVRRLGLTLETLDAPFEPEPGAYGAARDHTVHGHGHGHGDGAGHA